MLPLTKLTVALILSAAVILNAEIKARLLLNLICSTEPCFRNVVGTN